MFEGKNISGEFADRFHASMKALLDISATRLQTLKEEPLTPLESAAVKVVISYGLVGLTIAAEHEAVKAAKN